MPSIDIIEDISAVKKCHGIISQLHSDLSYEQFLEVTERCYKNGYWIAALVDHGEIKAVVGFHLGESFAWKKYLYIVDLVTDKDCRGQGYGKMLLGWMKDYAKSHMCDQIPLDSRVIRHATHKFYLNNDFIIGGYHFVCEL